VSAAQNARDREHLARVRKAAPKLLDACVIAKGVVAETAYCGDRLSPRVLALLGSAIRVLAAAIAATQPPAKRKGKP